MLQYLVAVIKHYNNGESMLYLRIECCVVLRGCVSEKVRECGCVCESVGGKDTSLASLLFT